MQEADAVATGPDLSEEQPRNVDDEDLALQPGEVNVEEAEPPPFSLEAWPCRGIDVGLG